VLVEVGKKFQKDLAEEKQNKTKKQNIRLSNKKSDHFITSQEHNRS